MAIYLFIDESGNLDFSENGSRYFLLGVLSTRDPRPMAAALTDLRYELLAEGLELECFHAAEDTHAVRSRVFALLTQVGGFEVDVLVADKRAMHPDLRDPAEFYAYLAHVLIDAVVRRLLDFNELVIVVTDRIPLQSRRKAFEKAFKQGLREIMGDRVFWLVHHPSAADPGLQAADYCTWAVQRAWQRGDTRPFEHVRARVRSQWMANDGRLIGTIPLIAAPFEEPTAAAQTSAENRPAEEASLAESPAEAAAIGRSPADATAIKASVGRIQADAVEIEVSIETSPADATALEAPAEKPG